MKRAFYLGIFLAVVLTTSCSSVVDQAAEEEKHQRAVALYDDPEHSEKCEAIFRRLRTRLKPGMTSAQAAKSLGSLEWMRHTNSNQVIFLGGWIPVDIGFSNRAFGMSLYPNTDGWSNYRVYFSIACPEPYVEGFTIGQFLSGEVHGRDVRLHQLALCFPGKAPNDSGRYEVIPKPKSEQGVAPQPAARSESNFSGSLTPST
jgi:hypothetical protein